MADLKVTTSTGTDTVLKEAVVAELRASLRGDLLCPNDDGYNEARSPYCTAG